MNKLTKTALVAMVLSASLTGPARAQAASRCAAVPDCAGTYPKYVALFDAKWDMKLYGEFLSRYDELSKDRDYTLAADAKQPQAPRSEDEWYDKWAYRLPYNPRPWSLDLDSFKAELDGYLRGFDETQALFSRLASLDDPKILAAALREKHAGAFPGEMGREKFKAEDLVYVYLGAERRDFLRRKVAALKGHKDRKEALASLGAQAPVSPFVSVPEPKPAAVAAPATQPPHQDAPSQAVPAQPAKPAAPVEPSKIVGGTSKAVETKPAKTDWDAKYPASAALDGHTARRYLIPTRQLLADWKALKAEGGHTELLARIEKELGARWGQDAVNGRRVAALSAMDGMKEFLAAGSVRVVRQGRDAAETAPEETGPESETRRAPKKAAQKPATKRRKIVGDVPSPPLPVAVSHPQPWKNRPTDELVKLATRQPAKNAPLWRSSIRCIEALAPLIPCPESGL